MNEPGTETVRMCTNDTRHAWRMLAAAHPSIELHLQVSRGRCGPFHPPHPSCLFSMEKSTNEICRGA